MGAQLYKHVTLRSHIMILRDLFSVMEVRFRQLGLQVGLSILVAVLDAVGLALLVPLAQGVASADFSFVSDNFFLRWVFAFLPASAQLDQLSVSKAFLLVASLVFGANLLAIMIGYANLLYTRYLQGIYLSTLRTKVYGRYLTFGKAFFDRTSQGHVRRILEYTEKIVTLVKISRDTLTNISRLLAMVVVMLIVSWKMALFVTAVFPILFIVSRFVMKRVDVWWNDSKEIMLDLGKESFNMLSALPLVWSYSQEQSALKTYRGMNNELRKTQLKAYAFGDLASFIPQGVTLIAMLAVAVFISATAFEGTTEGVTGAVVFLYIASRTLPLFKVFNVFRVAYSELLPPIREVLSLFSEESHAVVSGTEQFSGLFSDIEFRNFSFSYAVKSKVLNNVSLRIPAKSFTALVGPSGSGKSTIFNILMRFYDCEPDTIFFDGQDVRTFSIESVRKNIAYIDQDPLLIHDTFLANVAYGLGRIAEERLQLAIQGAQLEDVVARLPNGLETIVGDRGVQLSGGERQRVSIARALLKDSAIILLDEATSALDSQTELLAHKALVTATTGKTVVAIAHRLSTIQGADVIVYLERGQVVELGSLSELLAIKGKFYEQWQQQARVSAHVDNLA